MPCGSSNYQYKFSKNTLPETSSLNNPEEYDEHYDIIHPMQKVLLEDSSPEIEPPITCCVKEVSKNSEPSTPDYRIRSSGKFLPAPISNVKNVAIGEFNKKAYGKNLSKNQPKGLVVSLRYRKYSRKSKPGHLLSQSVVGVKMNTKNIPFKKRIILEEQPGSPKIGKRGRLGGKARGKPPVEEIVSKGDSDEEVENLYFYRVSLGHFQQIKDQKGASTSYQPENFRFRSAFIEPIREENYDSEEMELLELQTWGMSSSISTYLITDKIEHLSTSKNNEDFRLNSDI